MSPPDRPVPPAPTRASGLRLNPSHFDRTGSRVGVAPPRTREDVGRLEGTKRAPGLGGRVRKVLSTLRERGAGRPESWSGDQPAQTLRDPTPTRRTSQSRAPFEPLLCSVVGVCPNPPDLRPQHRLTPSACRPPRRASRERLRCRSSFPPALAQSRGVRHRAGKERRCGGPGGPKGEGGSRLTLHVRPSASWRGPALSRRGRLPQRSFAIDLCSREALAGRKETSDSSWLCEWFQPKDGAHQTTVTARHERDEFSWTG